VVIKGLLVFAILVGTIAFMVAAIASPDSGETTRWAGSWPVEHPEWFGVASGVGVFVIGLLILIATNTLPARSHGERADRN
jgi:uncharacterized membrane protein YkgB